MVFPEKEQGTNRQMYVEGNPMMWRDVSGNKISTSLSWAIMGAMGALHAGLSPEMGFAAGAEIGRGRERQARGRRFENRARFARVDRFLSSSFNPKGLAQALSLPGKVGTKEAWKQAMIAGLQTNWNLSAMTQGYVLGRESAKRRRFNANKVLSGSIKIVVGAVATGIGIIVPGAGALAVVGIPLIAAGGDEYNEGIGGSKEDKQLVCATEGKSNISFCYWGTASPASSSSPTSSN
jgi:hypothetical protein